MSETVRNVIGHAGMSLAKSTKQGMGIGLKQATQMLLFDMPETKYYIRFGKINCNGFVCLVAIVKAATVAHAIVLRDPKNIGKVRNS